MGKPFRNFTHCQGNSQKGVATSHLPKGISYETKIHCFSAMIGTEAKMG